MRTITIGRDDSCDIIINNERVSRFHANVIPEGNGYIYRDTSSNGTVINGTMIRNGDKYIQYGDQVLLAGNISLPWNRIQSMSPTKYNGRGANDFERNYYPSSEVGYNGERYDNIEYKSGTGLITFGYIFAILGGWLAILFGLILATSKEKTPDGQSVFKYKASSRTNGWIIFGLATFLIIVYLIIYFNN